MIIKITKFILSWILGIALLLFGLFLLSTGSYLIGTLITFGAILIIPFFGKFLLKKITFKIFFMIKIIVFILIIGILITTLINKEEPSQKVMIQEDVDYIGNGVQKQTLNLFYFDTKSPLIIFVHGGGWKMGGKEGCMAQEFVKEGYAVACIGYRLSGEAKFPSQIQDIKSAVRWLRANAKKYNLDETKFVAWGDSAGGHLVSLLGTSEGNFEVGPNLNHSSKVQFVVDWYGPTDPSKIIPIKEKFREYYDAVGELLGNQRLEEYPEKNIQLMNPINYIDKDDSQFLIIHGDKDSTVPVEQSREFYQALKKAGVKVDYKEIKGAEHGGIEFEKKALPLVKQFFQDNLKR